MVSKKLNISDYMRLPMASALCFVLVFFLGDRVGAVLLGELFHSTQFRYAELYRGELSAQRVFIGNSRCVHMFHRPAVEAATGDTMANIGFNGLPAQMMPVLLEDYLAAHPQPVEVWIEVSCVGRKNEPAALERFSAVQDRSASFARVLRTQNQSAYWATQLSHLYRFNSPLLWRSLFFLRSSDQDWIMDSQLPEEWNQESDPDLYQHFHQVESDLASLKQSIQLAQEQGIAVRLILAPYVPEYESRLEGKAAWIQWLESSTQLTVEDHSNSIVQHELFADPLHLNAAGAEVFAKRLFPTQQ